MRIKIQHLSSLLVILVFLVLSIPTSLAQDISSDTTRVHVVIKNDKTQFVGVILSQDPREVLIRTDKLGEVIIPRHEIREIKEILPEEVKDGVFIGEEVFATRYFITTNGLPIKKGESYVQWNLFGPDFQFGVAENFGLGVMTSWFAIPVIGTAKYSRSIGPGASWGVGALLGTGSWAQPDLGIMLPFMVFTAGDRRNNVNLSAGYGAVFYKNEVYSPNPPDYSTTEKYREGRFLFSFAGMFKVSPSMSIVFDTFIVPQGGYREYTDWVYDEVTFNPVAVKKREKSPGLFLIIPGLRFQTNYNQAFQFGFTGFSFDGQFVPLPIPMVQWYRKL